MIQQTSQVLNWRLSFCPEEPYKPPPSGKSGSGRGVPV